MVAFVEMHVCVCVRVLICRCHLVPLHLIGATSKSACEVLFTTTASTLEILGSRSGLLLVLILRTLTSRSTCTGTGLLLETT